MTWPNGTTLQVAGQKPQTLSQLGVIGANYWHLGGFEIPKDKPASIPEPQPPAERNWTSPANRFLRCHDHLQPRSLQPFKHDPDKKLLGFLVEIHSEFRIHPPSANHIISPFSKSSGDQLMWAQCFNLSFMVPGIGIMFTPIQGNIKVVYKWYILYWKKLADLYAYHLFYQNLEKSMDF